MGQVTVRVNGYNHTIGCRDGEEQHVLHLVSQIEEKVRLIRAMGGQFSEARMLLHVALLLADELGDLRAEMERMRSGAPASAPAPAAPAPSPDPQLAERLARIAERIENIAQTLDRP
ncbi:MAG: cell division protein ZapA [Acetobacteraceae bacterium]|nr:cell division protein ZapA [Acetobacteraceae bacterium]MDI3308993.1 cell division protein ZapA [Acetobacteraceae bacterium]